MKRLPNFFRWLVWAALADWLIMRTLTRSAIFMPKSSWMIVVYQTLTTIGQLAATLASLLALGAMGWMGWRYWRTNRRVGAPLIWMSLLTLSLAFIFIAPAGWLLVGYHLLVIVSVILLSKQIWVGQVTNTPKAAEALPALALLIGELYQLGPAFYEAMRWPGPPPFTGALFNLGELLVILSPVALWWVYGRKATRQDGMWAALPSLAFAAMYLLNPALTSIVAIWSTGLTLYLPWPLYALSLWLAGLTVMASLRREDGVGWAILLLAAGGYTPQLSTQVFFGLTALWWLAQPDSLSPCSSQRMARVLSNPVPVTSPGL